MSETAMYAAEEEIPDAVKAEGAITTSLRQLQREIERQNNVLARLHDGLEPILIPETPRVTTDPDGPMDPTAAVPLALNLDAIRDALREHNARLDRMANRIAL